MGGAVAEFGARDPPDRNLNMGANAGQCKFICTGMNLIEMRYLMVRIHRLDGSSCGDHPFQDLGIPGLHPGVGIEPKYR
jgi:hypothetical protein